MAARTHGAFDVKPATCAGRGRWHVDGTTPRFDDPVARLDLGGDVLLADARWISPSVVSRSALGSAICARALLSHDDVDLPPDAQAILIAGTLGVHRRRCALAA
jgi:hypothetical protein